MSATCKGWDVSSYFPKWRVVVDPGTVDLTVNTADLNVTINGVSYATTDGNNYTAKLNHLYPGTYNFVASGKVNDQDITVSSEENVTSKNRSQSLCRVSQLYC